eukprot:CAMPEP_0170585850 /NCGR_PEP_ID=MMETSP0224-20130122/9437_1 /TAXON_ID=285029 /ORGANISM="Togula jolla, Strain CCCM 725" /LENGTH=74 /DNA_ID=CAMNT_0010909369 /DNA_START=878 /DNA_END=1103 /DNA_ORIENTATION=-
MKFSLSSVTAATAAMLGAPGVVEDKIEQHPAFPPGDRQPPHSNEVPRLLIEPREVDVKDLDREGLAHGVLQLQV